MPRLIDWLCITVGLLIALALLNPQQLPVVLYKLTLVALGVPATYWIDRALFPYARPHEFLTQQSALSSGERHVSTAVALLMMRRAVILLAVVLGLTLGL